MKKVFAPAVALLNRLTYPRKFGLIGLLFSLPLGLVTFFLVSELNDRIAFSAKERLGNEYLRPVQKFAADLREHRGLSWSRADQQDTSEELRRVDEQLQRDIQDIDAVDRKLGATLGSTQLWTAIKGKCRTLQSSPTTVTPLDPTNRHSALITDLIALMSQVGDQSNLILDPDLDSYYLMELTVNRLPQLTEEIGQARGFCSGLANRDSISELESFRLRNLSSAIESQRETLNHHLDVVFRETRDPELAKNLEPALNRVVAATNRFLELIADQRVRASGSRASADAVWQQGSETLNEYEQLYSLTSAALDRLLAARVSTLANRRLFVTAVTFPCVLLVLYLFVAFYLAVMRTVAQLDSASQRLLSGQWDDMSLSVDTHDELGQVTKSFGALAARLKTECTALRESEERTRLIVDNALDAVITMNSAGDIIGWNAQAESMFGWSRSEALGQSLSETIVPPEHREAHNRGLQHFLKTGEGPVLNNRIEISAMHRDGREFPSELTVCPAKVGDGYLFSAFVRDITEQKRAKSELEAARDAAEAANRAKSQFLANMSHEIRTPMNGVLGMTELALGTELTAEQREYLDLVKSSANSLLTVINDILDFSKIEAGKLPLESLDFSLIDCLGDAIKSIGIRAHQKGLELVGHIAPDVPDMLIGDPGRLRQVVMNLSGNAIKFTDEGEVVVSVRTESRGANDVLLHFTVTDTGVGIPADKLQLIFRPFEQADGSTTRKFGGTGLGLSISSQLIELMGGRIWVESEPGCGSTFHFTMKFPLSEQASLRAVRQPSAALRGLPVLIIDDNATNRAMLVEMLSHWQMCPTAVENGRLGLMTMQLSSNAGKSYPLVLIDAEMPDMDGFAVAEQIRRDPKLAGVSIMLLTTTGQRTDVERCRQLGISAYLTKPVKQSDLFDVIVTAMGTSALEGETTHGRITTSGDDAPAAAPTTNRFMILLAEDNAVNQRVAVRLLQKQGHTVAVAENGREAVERLAHERFDLVLMDVQMPEMDGLEATAAIRAQEKSTGQHLPIIAMTAHAMSGDRERCLEAGMDGYVSKPIQPQLLFDTIASVVAKSAAESAAHRTINSHVTIPTATTTNNEHREEHMQGMSSTTKPVASTSRRGDVVNRIDVVNRNDVFNHGEMLTRLGDDLELVTELIELFLEESPKLLVDVQLAVQRRDAKAIERAAHRLKGSAGNFGINATVKAAMRLEILGRKGDLAEVDSICQSLAEELRQLQEELDQWSEAETTTLLM
ncbi:MAG: response regulator [Planctomycetaceae bacterium]